MLVSYDITALYPSVPQDEAISVVSSRLQNDKNLHAKTKVSAENLVGLFRTCVEKTYFVFNKKLYQQVNGLAIGASTSGFASDLFMEELEKRALATFTNPPTMWKRYVDDTITKLKHTVVNDFLQHLNNQHPRIKFTTELQKDNQIPFLDTKIQIEEDRSLTFTVYRKKTHTDQYLDFTSNHHVKQKTGIIRTFEHRIDTLVTKQVDKEAEKKHVKEALRRCGHPEWVLNRPKKKRTVDKQEGETIGRVVLPYVKHLSEKVARAYRKHRIQTVHRPTWTLGNILCCSKKDKVHDMDKSGVIYQVECKRHNAVYIGETERAMKARAYDHRVVSHEDTSINHSIKTEVRGRERTQQPRRSRREVKRVDNYKTMHTGEKQILTLGTTPVSEHMARYQDEHREDDVSIKVIGREDNWFKRGIKEAIKIKETTPNLNIDEGRYHISAIYSLIDENHESVTSKSRIRSKIRELGTQQICRKIQDCRRSQHIKINSEEGHS